jgi:hypothetical protein
MSNTTSTTYNKILEKRLYTFSHMMLSDTAKGIQALHSTVELFNQYVPNPGNDECVDVQNDVNKDPYSILWDWSIFHKTSILLNAGNSIDLDKIVTFLDEYEVQGDNFYPWALFQEDESLEHLITSVSIVLTEKIYTAASDLRQKLISLDTRGIVTVLDWDKYNSTFSLYEYEELQNKYGDYDFYSEFEIKLVQLIQNMRLA